MVWKSSWTGGPVAQGTVYREKVYAVEGTMVVKEDKREDRYASVLLRLALSWNSYTGSTL